MGTFRRLGELALTQLDDGELIEYALAAREAGDAAAAQLALGIFAFGMEARLRAFVRVRLGAHGDAAIEEVAGRALEDALRSLGTLAGTTAEEARGFVFQIARRRIADHLRKARPIADTIDDREGAGGAVVPAALQVEDDTGEVETNLFVNELLADLSPHHRAVVDHNVLMGYSARDTVERLRGRDRGIDDDSLTEQNVHQIASRFRKRLRARLAEAGEDVRV